MSEILNIIQNLYVINPFLCAVIIYLVLKVRQHEERLKKFDTMKIESTLVEIKTFFMPYIHQIPDAPIAPSMLPSLCLKKLKAALSV